MTGTIFGGPYDVASLFLIANIVVEGSIFNLQKGETWHHKTGLFVMGLVNAMSFLISLSIAITFPELLENQDGSFRWQVVFELYLPAVIILEYLFINLFYWGSFDEKRKSFQLIIFGNGASFVLDLLLFGLLFLLKG